MYTQKPDKSDDDDDDGMIRKRQLVYLQRV